MARINNRGNGRPKSGKSFKDDKKLEQLNSKQLNKGNSSRSQRRTKEIDDSVLRQSQSNDYSWYSKFPQFTKDAGTLAFGIPLGQAINLSDTDQLFVPGVMRLGFYPTPGYSEDLTSPINRSAIRFYTFLRDVQKAAAKYDSADIMMYLMALDSCYMFHSMMRRAYGIAQLFTPVNKYYPAKLFPLLGFDPSLLDNLAEFRAYINRFALSLGSYCLPKGFDISVRHRWMCEGLYLDSETTRAQTYVFVPEGFWRFDNTVTTGSELTFVAWMNQSTDATTLHTLQDLQDLGKLLMDNLLGDQDTGNISGDLYKAYGASGLLKLEETPESYAIMPSYNTTVLSQIENATLVGVFADNYTPKISQNPGINNGAILFTPKFKGIPQKFGTNYHQPYFEKSSRLINMHKDNPSPEDVIEATRLMASAFLPYKPNPDSSMIFPTIFGADLVSRCYIQVFTSNAQAQTIFFKSNGLAIHAATDAQLQLICMLAQFDWHPLMLGWLGTEDGTSDIQYIFGDTDNVTVVSSTQLAMMHEASMLSLLDVPQMGI